MPRKKEESNFFADTLALKAVIQADNLGNRRGLHKQSIPIAVGAFLGRDLCDHPLVAQVGRHYGPLTRSLQARLDSRAFSPSAHPEILAGQLLSLALNEAAPRVYRDKDIGPQLEHFRFFEKMSLISDLLLWGEKVLNYSDGRLPGLIRSASTQSPFHFQELFPPMRELLTGRAISATPLRSECKTELPYDPRELALDLLSYNSMRIILPSDRVNGHSEVPR